MTSMSKRREMVERHHKGLSIVQQCMLLSIHRSGLYYKPQGESELNEELMKLIDKQYLIHPHMGAPRMHTWLTEDMGYRISKNRVERLYYRVMGLRAIMPGPHTSKRGKSHPVHPYLLRDLKVTHANQVWAADITYIPMSKGFMYMFAIIDVQSRMILNWSISNTMDAEWCVEVVKEAIDQYGRPEIFNTDQGTQFTSEALSGFILGQGIKLSMDGKGRATDNAYIERFWRTLKYEHVYLKPTEDTIELYRGIQQFIKWYNVERRHTSLGNLRPKEVYEQALSKAA